MNAIPIAHITHASGGSCSFCSNQSVISDAFPCSVCGVMIWSGQYHGCGGTPTYPSAGAAATPHRCPVCEGRGFVPAGFYSGSQSTSANPELCRSCATTGIIWRS
jgi:hypothetical protein